MAGADLRRVVELLHSERMAEQVRLLRAAIPFAELRSAVTAVYNDNTVSRGDNLALMLSIQSLAAPLRQLLEALLHTKIRSDGWHQVRAFLFRKGFSRSNTLRDLRQFTDEFETLASYVSQVHFPIYRSSTSSSDSTNVDDLEDTLPAWKVRRSERMVGRSELLEKMVSMVLAGSGLLVLPILGGPGIGKTSLAKALMSDRRVERKFGMRLVVPFMQIQDYFPEAVASHNGEDYLIVLDDVWTDSERNCPEIGSLMKVLPSNCSLIVTTRSPDVVSYLGTVAANTAKPLYLQPLEKEFSFSFVAEWIWRYHGDWPAELTREAGTAIADKCGGVPILLDHAHQQFCKPQGLMFWQGFLKSTSAGMYFWRELLACIHELPHDEFWRKFIGQDIMIPSGNVVLESAAISYRHLPSDMWSCLLYCCMFPSGHDFDVEELTDLFAAEGYLPPVVTKAQRKGYIQQLLDECFYPLQGHEYGDKCTYRMHKVLHIFAQFMDSKTSSIIRVDQATKATSQSLNSIRRASLIVNPSVVLFPTSLFQSNDLETLILLHEGSTFPPDQPRCEITEIPQVIFQRRIKALNLRATKIKMLPNKFLEPYHVKYLNLAQTDIENIPSSISRLMFLQTLILCHCNKLQKLHPNTTKLALLQKLDLEGCFNLVELPQGLSKMMRLEYLNITECSLLTQLPRGLSQLKNLQVLLGYIVSYADGCSLSDLQPLANLHKLSLQGLEKVSDPLDARFAGMDSKTILDSLSLQWDTDDYSNDTIPAYSYAVLESLRPYPRRLKALEIVGYDGDKLPPWITGPHLKSLVEIKLINLRSCELPPLGLLPSLKNTEISGAETICSVNGNFYGRNGIFPSLEKLTFSYMHNLEVWEQEHRQGMFPCLRELVIIQCPKLRALNMELRSLEKLILWMNNKMLYDLKGALRGLVKTLEHISISFSEELLASSDCEGLQDLGKLTKLEICGCDELAFLPKGLQHLSSIRSMTIDSCRKLEALPDWLENLPYLKMMRLSGCPQLHSIPRGLQQRPGILIYVVDCPNLPKQPFPGFPAHPLGNPVDTKGKEIIMENA